MDNTTTSAHQAPGIVALARRQAELEQGRRALAEQPLRLYQRGVVTVAELAQLLSNVAAT